MFKFLKRISALEEEVSVLEAQVRELSKKTVSQMTTADEKPKSKAQIYDEWMNGEEGNE